MLFTDITRGQNAKNIIIKEGHVYLKPSFKDVL